MNLKAKKENRQGRPRKKDMVRWVLSVKKNIKDETQAHLRELEVTDSDHLMHLLNSVDLSKFTNRDEYLKHMYNLQL